MPFSSIVVGRELSHGSHFIVEATKEFGSFVNRLGAVMRVSCICLARIDSLQLRC